MYKLKTKSIPTCFNGYFVSLSKVHSCSTRFITGDNYSLTCSSKSNSQCSIRYQGPKIWNELPTDIKNFAQKSKHSFIKKIKEFLNVNQKLPIKHFTLHFLLLFLFVFVFYMYINYSMIYSLFVLPVVSCMLYFCHVCCAFAVCICFFGVFVILVGVFATCAVCFCVFAFSYLLIDNIVYNFG